MNVTSYKYTCIGSCGRATWSEFFMVIIIILVQYLMNHQKTVIHVYNVFNDYCLWIKWVTGGYICNHTSKFSLNPFKREGCVAPIIICLLRMTRL